MKRFLVFSVMMTVFTAFFNSPDVCSAEEYDHAVFPVKYDSDTTLWLDGYCTVCHSPHGGTGGLNNAYAQAIADELALGYTTDEALTNVELIDTDGDGFDNVTEIYAYTYPADPNSHPDSTTSIIVGRYNYLNGNLVVKATSNLGENADLELIGFGPMVWNANKLFWRIKVSNTTPPESLTVCDKTGSCVTTP